MRLTIINTMLTIVLIALIAIVILSRAIVLQRNGAMENMNNLASSTAKDIQSRYQTYVQVAKTLALIMDSYESADIETRRTRYQDILRSVFESFPDFTGIYTFWQPNVLDGRDAQYAGARTIAAHYREEQRAPVSRKPPVRHWGKKGLRRSSIPYAAGSLPRSSPTTSSW
jgi:methyl-accepting chemotaxis protein